MRAIQNADGHVGLTAREYPIAGGTAVRRGQVVRLSGGKVVPAAAAQTAAVLGIAAENHAGAADVFNPRADGASLLVYDSPALIFECPAPEITAAAGSATTVTAAAGQVAGAIADDAFNGGALQLAVKTGGSANTDQPGAVREITDYTASGLVFTVPDGGTAAAGDVYRVYPPAGFTACALDSGILRAVISATGAAAIRVVGRDTERGTIRCMAAVHSLGNDD